MTTSYKFNKFLNRLNNYIDFEQNNNIFMDDMDQTENNNNGDYIQNTRDDGNNSFQELNYIIEDNPINLMDEAEKEINSILNLMKPDCSLSESKINSTQENEIDKEKGGEKDFIENREIIEEKLIIEMEEINNQPNNDGKKQGRKKKGEITKGNHTKFSSDNIITKIKSHFFKFMHHILNDAIKEKKYKFKPNCYKEIIKNTAKIYNINLMNLTLKQIYQESIKHIDEYDKIKNLKKIRKALKYLSIEENQEKEKYVIELLNEKFIEFYNNFKEQFMEIFLKELEKKNEKEYVERVKEHCNIFPEWFQNKKERIRKK